MDSIPYNSHLPPFGHGKVKKVLLIFGTRPDAVKMCPLVLTLRSRSEFDATVCVTAQHRQMLDQVLGAFGVVPEYDLAVMRERQSLPDVTRAILGALPSVLEETEPDIALVHGDTATAFAASLACFYRRLPVGHVEAGLRTRDMNSPYPEEFNRTAISLTAALHFAPTAAARDNLLGEGRDPATVFVTGNTGIDALKTTVRADWTHSLLDWARGSRLLLVTAHRRENLGDAMRGMFRAIRRIVDEHPDVKAVYPVHKNPLVMEAAREVLGGCERIRLIEPLDVVDFHNLLARAYLVMTDSGGIQEEAPSLGKPVLVMRDATERPEGVAAGTLRLVGTDERAIFREADKLLGDQDAYRAMAAVSNPYGDGRACDRIADILARW